MYFIYIQREKYIDKIFRVFAPTNTFQVFAPQNTFQACLPRLFAATRYCNESWRSAKDPHLRVFPRCSPQYMMHGPQHVGNSVNSPYMYTKYTTYTKYIKYTAYTKYIKIQYTHFLQKFNFEFSICCSVVNIFGICGIPSPSPSLASVKVPFWGRKIWKKQVFF